MTVQVQRRCFKHMKLSPATHRDVKIYTGENEASIMSKRKYRIYSGKFGI